MFKPRRYGSWGICRSSISPYSPLRRNAMLSEEEKKEIEKARETVKKLFGKKEEAKNGD